MKKLAVLILIVLIITFTTIITGCGKNFIVYETFNYFGCPISIAVKTNNDVKYKEFLNKTLNKIEELENKFSTTKQDSLINKFNKLNKDEYIELDDETASIIKLAMELYEKTDGAFNPAIYPLTRLWGFSNEQWNDESFTFVPPSEDSINDLLNICSFDNVKLENNRLIKKNYDNVMLDFGGILKGYVTDIFSDLLKEYNYNEGYISLGASSLFLAKYSNHKKWKISLKNPYDKAENYLSFEAENSYVSTSGNYERFYEYENEIYCHIINPFSGYPVTANISSSATVVGSNGASADALTTAFMVLGKDTAEKVLNENFNDYKLFLTYSANNKVLFTNANVDYFTLIDTSFIVEN